MTDIIRAIILGAVEGITEFLPISSTGHLILVNQWISFAEEFTKVFDIFIQVGAILAVIIYFWRKLAPFGRTEIERRQVLDIWKKTIVGVTPAILIGGTLGKVIQEKLFNPLTVSLALLAGGIILIWVERRKFKPNIESVHDLPFRLAFWIGAIQCLAMIPGTSRSAATIIGAMLLGASRLAAVEFSFFLAIPTLAAASAYSLLKHKSSFTWDQAGLLAIGFVVSFVVALAVIALFVRFVSKRDFKAFGVYRIVLALLVLTCFGMVQCH